MAQLAGGCLCQNHPHELVPIHSFAQEKCLRNCDDCLRMAQLVGAAAPLVPPRDAEAFLSSAAAGLQAAVDAAARDLSQAVYPAAGGPPTAVAIPTAAADPAAAGPAAPAPPAAVPPAGAADAAAPNGAAAPLNGVTEAAAAAAAAGSRSFATPGGPRLHTAVVAVLSHAAQAVAQAALKGPWDAYSASTKVGIGLIIKLYLLEDVYCSWGSCRGSTGRVCGAESAGRRRECPACSYCAALLSHIRLQHVGFRLRLQ